MEKTLGTMRLGEKNLPFRRLRRIFVYKLYFVSLFGFFYMADTFSKIFIV